MVKITSSVNLAPLNGFIDKFRQEADIAVRKTAFKIESDAKTFTPVDTGALRASIYTVTPRTSTYSSATASARGLNPDFRATVEIQAKQELLAYVAVGASYGVFVEYGTRRMPARPFLTPAADMNKAFFNKEIRDALRRSWRP